MINGRQLLYGILFMNIILYPYIGIYLLRLLIDIQR